MTTRAHQSRTHGDRYFGSVTAITAVLTAGDTTQRRMNVEEARSYYLTVTGSALGFMILVPQLDSRFLEVGGPHFTVFNSAASTRNVLVSNNTSVQITSLPPGNHIQLMLKDNSTADGVWVGLTMPTLSGLPSGARTWLS